MTDELRNLNWKRPADWEYPEDWNSPAWQKRMQALESKMAIRKEKYGFLACPKCKTQHTTKTLTCRKCEYRAVE